MTESARSRQQSGDRPRWIDAADRVVLSLHRNGFLQSLIFHVALLLVLALTVIQPAAVTGAVRLALAFTANEDAPVDVQDVEMETADLLESVPSEMLAVHATIPDEGLAAAADNVQPAFESADVEVDSLDGAVQFAGLNVDELLAEVPGAIRPAAASRAPAGQRGDGLAVAGGGFGGELGRRLQAAGARTGDVQVSIAWDNFNDIDVHVMVESIAPRRGVSMINFSNRRGACGGWLDVDQNVVPMTPAAVENVFWAHGAAPYGRYTVYVHQYRNWGGPDPTRVRIAILVDGRQSHHEAVVHAHSGPVVVTSFIRQPGDPAVRAAAGAEDASLAPAP